MAQKRFYLSQTDKKIAGVCGGLAEYFDIDPLLVRVAILILILCYGGGLFLYIVLALLAPKGPENNQSESSFGSSWANTSDKAGSSTKTDNRKPNQNQDWGGSHYDKG